MDNSNVAPSSSFHVIKIWGNTNREQVKGLCNSSNQCRSRFVLQAYLTENNIDCGELNLFQIKTFVFLASLILPVHFQHGIIIILIVIINSNVLLLWFLARAFFLEDLSSHASHDNHSSLLLSQDVWKGTQSVRSNTTPPNPHSFHTAFLLPGSTGSH